ncbi:MAG: hypothetical protein IPK76_07275 [Lewinellaceae bacterium]|nr:hypothetical protein [Lewinellaceae bacterium]
MVKSPISADNGDEFFRGNCIKKFDRLISPEDIFRIFFHGLVFSNIGKEGVFQPSAGGGIFSA